MIIIRVLCHNAVIVRDEKNRRAVVIGNGIGFNRRKGDAVDKEKIEMLYIEHTQTNQQLINSQT